VLRLEGKSAIITGAGRGIGKAIARKFLQEGARVLICDIVPERIAASARDLGQHGEVHHLDGDVTSPTFCDALVKRSQELFSELNILVNNAGIAVVESFLEHSEEAWHRTLAVNLTSMFLLGQRAARVMVAQGKGGAIVNMASTNGHVGEKGLAAYNASKAGVVLLTKTMAIELAAHRIRVNCVAPGFILTELTEQAGFDRAAVDAYLEKIPLGRHGRPEDVANVFAFLASDEAAFITGDSVVVDGGQLSEE
jgi:NAD(P)-dependent dehydrogenase (short-subunit alcohol dehydrogenase family)